MKLTLKARPRIIEVSTDQPGKVHSLGHFSCTVKDTGLPGRPHEACYLLLIRSNSTAALKAEMHPALSAVLGLGQLLQYSS
jgi:hypothetical protein